MTEILPPDPDRRGRSSVPDDAPYGDVPVGTPNSDATPPPEVGHARSNAVTAAMLARYLVGRAIAERVSISLMVIALSILAGAVALWIWVSHGLAIFIGIIALLVLMFRALVMAILRRVMAVGQLGAAEDKIRAMVSDTGGDLRRELRRIGLPGSVFGIPLLAIRLIGRRRRDTLHKLGNFDVTNVVPKSRLNELQFVVQNDILGRRPPR